MLCSICGKGMHFGGIDKDSSCGLQTTLWRCNSLNSKHDLGIVEVIPGFEVFINKDFDFRESNPARYSITPEKRKAMMKMIKEDVPPPDIASALGMSHQTVYKAKRRMK